MKASAVSTITKSLPIALSVLVNYSLLATLGYINLFSQKQKKMMVFKVPTYETANFSVIIPKEIY